MPIKLPIKWPYLGIFCLQFADTTPSASDVCKVQVVGGRGARVDPGQAAAVDPASPGIPPWCANQGQ